jgi:Fe-Mn family superoxide dismutase
MIRWLWLFVCICSLSAAAPAPYQAKDFSHLLGMPGLSEDLLQMHFKLYQGYVKNTNGLIVELKSLENSGQARSYEYGALKRRFGWEFDGMRLHELYFGNLGGSGRPKLAPALMKALLSQYGSYQKWESDFIATGLIRGIGWGVLYIDSEDGRLINTWINEHDTGHLATGSILLVMDVWEHAFMPQFGLDKEKYIQVFFSNLDWKVVEERYLSVFPSSEMQQKKYQHSSTQH